MSIIFYYDAETFHACQEYTEDLTAALLNREVRNGMHLETLSKYNINCLRTNKEQRILYTYFLYQGKRHPLILEFLEHHQYHRSKFLRLNVVPRFLKANETGLIEAIQEADFVPAELPPIEQHLVTMRGTYTSVHFGHDILVFDEVQQQTLSQMKPLVIHGPPGSGKTSLAFAFLLDGVITRKLDRILYVTQSRNLVNQMIKDWQAHPEYVEHQEKIEILAYEDLFKVNDPQFSWDVARSKSVFEGWFDIYKKLPKNKGNKVFSGYSNSTIYQEFRIISGHTKTDYFSQEVGVKQSLVQMAERQYLFEAYTAWLTYLNDSHIILCDFAKIPPRAVYDLVLVDEAQDDSNLQFSELLGLSNQAEIVLFMDPRQRLTDSISQLIYIRNLLIRQTKVLSEIVLPTSYRCPRKVTEFARVFDDFRKQLTPPQKSDAHILGHTDVVGHVEWIIPGDIEQEAYLRSMNDDANVCVITQPDFVAEVKEKLGFVQVFTAGPVKGLQYRDAILYKMLDVDILYEASKRLGDTTPEKDLAFSVPFSACFMAAMRAMYSVFFYQADDPRLSKIMERLRPVLNAVDTKASSKEQSKQSAPEEWAVRAVSLLENGDLEQAKEVLREKLGKNDIEANEWILQHTKSKEVVTGQKSQEMVGQGRKNKKNKKGKEKEVPGTSSFTAGANSLTLTGAISRNSGTVVTGGTVVIGDGSPVLGRYLNAIEKDVGVQDESSCTSLSLNQAISNGNPIAVELMKKMGNINVNLENVNVQDESGYTSLHRAVMNSNRTAVETLIKVKNIDVNLKDYKEGLTPLALAFKNGKKDIACLLLDHPKIQFEVRDDSDYLYTALSKEVLLMQKLLERKEGLCINWNYRHSSDDSTPLIWICKDREIDQRNRQTLMLELVLNNSVDINAKDKEGRTALFFACVFENQGIIEYFLEFHLENFKTTFDGLSWKQRKFLLTKLEKNIEQIPLSDTPSRNKLGNVMQSQKPEKILADLFKIENLREFDSRVKVLGNINEEIFPNGHTLLSYACYKNIQPEKIKILLEQPGIAVNHKDKQNYSALALAFSEGSLETMRLLLSMPSIDVSCITSDMLSRPIRRIDWNYQSVPDKTTLLMWICRISITTQEEEGNKMRLAISLMQHTAADKNIKDTYGYTALFYACQSKSIGIIKFFLERHPENFELSFEGISLKDINIFNQTLIEMMPCVGDTRLLERLRGLTLKLEQKLALKENKLHQFEEAKNLNHPSLPNVVQKGGRISQQFLSMSS
jgi:ankyrin repeat protein